MSIIYILLGLGLGRLHNPFINENKTTTHSSISLRSMWRCGGLWWIFAKQLGLFFWVTSTNIFLPNFKIHKGLFKEPGSNSQWYFQPIINKEPPLTPSLVTRNSSPQVIKSDILPKSRYFQPIINKEGPLTTSSLVTRNLSPKVIKSNISDQS